MAGSMNGLKKTNNTETNKKLKWNEQMDSLSNKLVDKSSGNKHPG